MDVEHHNMYFCAAQGNVEALLQLGDSHWYGRGAKPDWGRAAQLYSAATRFRNAQAAFNLGAMHEYGVGLPQVCPCLLETPFIALVIFCTSGATSPPLVMRPYRRCKEDMAGRVST